MDNQELEVKPSSAVEDVADFMTPEFFWFQLNPDEAERYQQDPTKAADYAKPLCKKRGFELPESFSMSLYKGWLVVQPHGEEDKVVRVVEAMMRYREQRDYGRAIIADADLEAAAYDRRIAELEAEIRRLSAPPTIGEAKTALRPAALEYFNSLSEVESNRQEILQEIKGEKNSGLREVAYMRYFNHVDVHYPRLLALVKELAALATPPPPVVEQTTEEDFLGAILDEINAEEKARKLLHTKRSDPATQAELASTVPFLLRSLDAALAAFREADAIIEQTKSEDKWISVEDKMPEDLIAVIGWAPTFKRPVETYWCAGDWWIGESAGVEITHWQPLPSAPATPSKEASQKGNSHE